MYVYTMTMKYTINIWTYLCNKKVNVICLSIYGKYEHTSCNNEVRYITDSSTLIMGFCQECLNVSKSDTQLTMIIYI